MLGANDGLVSVASLIPGVAASGASRGDVDARLGGAPMGRAALRVGLWGAAAMALTAAIGALVGTAV
jgi:vacuolar iron transporter family protein